MNVVDLSIMPVSRPRHSAPYVSAPTPEKTMAALETKLPKRYWVEINKLLVPFGKHVCTGAMPKCSTCPLLSFCRQVGVTKRR